MKVLLYFIIAYLIGSLNPAIFITAITKGEDIRRYSDGNPGATNVYLNVNKSFGIIVGVIDALKSFIPLYFAQKSGLEGFQLALFGACIIIGHDFPVFYGFKGGTGISATIGGLFFFEPQMTVIILILCLISLKLLLYTKKGGILGFSPLETVESVGFILVILYLLKFGSSFSKSYMLLVTGVVVLRRIERVFNLFSEKRA